MAITKKDVNHIIAMIQELYLEDSRWADFLGH